MPQVPWSTYRVQLHAGFNFRDASAIADYLALLGVSHLYASPYLQSAPGSTHGYDLVDFRAVNEELGGSSGHEAFCQRLGECGLGQILDIVPNHMSLAQNNVYWLDVLENGHASRYIDYFDIDWQSGEERLRNKILLPILENQYGVVLSSGAIKLTRSEMRFQIVLGDTRLPVSPSSMRAFLAPAAQALRSDTLAFLADSLARITPQIADGADAMFTLRRDRKILFSLFHEYLTEQSDAVGTIDAAIGAINGNIDSLDAFLQEQHYRLAYWRSADQDLGYRRFFDVNSLVGVRVELEPVFFDTHRLILQWLKDRVLDGVRVDHVDGLRDPQHYLERLREAAPDAWMGVEKILARNETLSPSWPVNGTTGYDFLNLVNGLLVDREGLTALDDIYKDFIGEETDYPRLVHDKKIAVEAEALGSDVNRLTSIFVRICEADRDHRDHTRAEIRHAIREVAACFPIYRTYVLPDSEVSELDAAVIQTAVNVAAGYRSDIDRGLFDFIADVLLLRRTGPLESEFLLRFQQFTSPVMAKGLEDTALYCYNRLIGLNEVGCNLSQPVVSIDDFHRFNAQAQQSHPTGMVTLTTHDTKRGEDVRARLAVVSEIPQYFKAALARWFAMNSVFRVKGVPDPNTEYLYYQTLIGAWPISVDRVIAYMEKAAREAKQQTSWIHNNAAFEEALKTFIRQTLSNENFCEEVDAFVKLINKAGRINGLAQTLLKYTVPGVPDLYQGSELWDHRLVDPDNRGPVDYGERRRLLNEISGLTVRQVMDRMEEGLPKLWTVSRALRVRRQYPECFNAEGGYRPLLASGDMQDNIVAFVRGDRAITVAPRLSHAVTDGWKETVITVPAGRWINVLADSEVSGGRKKIDELLSEFPVALLTRED
jgi:(1->4)-alpha-D-glucan 1-alpha-D-glucosylmutase